MKICFLGDIRSDHVKKFIKFFAPDNETILISLDYLGDSRVVEGIKFFNRIGTTINFIKKSDLLKSPFIVRQMIKEINPDILQAHFITNYGFLGACSGHHPLIIFAMGDDILIHPFQSFIYKCFIKYSIWRADFITCDGFNSLGNLMDFGVPKSKLKLIYPGIDMKQFKPIYKIQKEKRVFYMRGFDKIYDVDLLFNTIRIIHNTMPEVKFDLLGNGTEIERFKNMIKENGMEDSITYLGYIQNEDVYKHIISSSVVITTSLSDGGMPVSTIESMACGVPVVSTNVGDVKMWIQNGVNGYVTDRNPLIMADSIITLLKDDEKRIKFGKAARERVEKDQDYFIEMNKIKYIYMKLLE